MIEHTPGPWHRNIKPASHYPVVFAGRNTHVAMVVSNGLPEDEVEANIALVTAAPELLAALILAEEFVTRHTEDWYVSGQNDLAVIRAAIAKAKGEHHVPTVQDVNAIPPG